MQPHGCGAAAGKYREAVAILLTDASRVLAPEDWPREEAAAGHLAQLRRRAARALLLARCLAPHPQDTAPLDEQLGLLYMDEVCC